jgi:hypothetical protein
LIPSFKMQIEGRRLYVSEPGLHFDSAGGIDEIDLDNLVALGFVTSEVQVPLNITGFVLTSPDKGYVVSHTDIVLSSHLQPFSRIDGSSLGPELTVSFSQVDSIVHDPETDQLFFPVPEVNGVLVFDATTQEQLNSQPIDTGSMPMDLLIARASTPGEATDLRVGIHDPAKSDLWISYTPACDGADHTIVFGPLHEVSSYGYSGQVCDIGSVGEYSGFDPEPGSCFFLVVANDGTAREGSYGTASTLNERPEDLGDPVCTFVQDLSRSCD